ncbi:MAG: hypothetical protein RL717_480, partial [Pseudomonadota bacterium]
VQVEVISILEHGFIHGEQKYKTGFGACCLKNAEREAIQFDDADLLCLFLEQCMLARIC